MRFATAVVVLVSLLAAACGSASDSRPADDRTSEQPPAPGTITRGNPSTNLETTPISAADYAMYAAIMGGASAMLSALSPEDKEALERSRKIDAGTVKATPQN